MGTIDLDNMPTEVRMAYKNKESGVLLLKNIETSLKCYDGLKVINSKLDKILSKKDTNITVNKTTNVSNDVGQVLDNWYGLKVPSYIPDISGKQIYKMNKMGWNIKQICAISGFSEEEAKKKYDTYVRNNL